jgi:RNA polymerase primary sigma factor
MKDFEQIAHWDEPIDFDRAEAVHEDEGRASANDPFGIYFAQMGAIPMLSRAQEIEMTQRLDRCKRRYRHAVLWNASVLQHVVETFERVRARELALDRIIDVVPSLGLTPQTVRARLPR